MGYEPLTYETYVYPLWANVLGWVIAGSSIAMIPGVAIYKLVTTPGTLIQVRRLQSLSWLRIFFFLWKQRFIYNSPPFVCILSQINPGHALTNYSLTYVRTHTHARTRTYRALDSSFPLRFSDVISHICSMMLWSQDSLSSSSAGNLPQVSHTPPQVQMLSSPPCLQHNTWYFIWLRQEVSCTFKTTGKTTVVKCILVITFLDSKREYERIRTDWSQPFFEINLFLLSSRRIFCISSWMFEVCYILLEYVLAGGISQRFHHTTSIYVYMCCRL